MSGCRPAQPTPAFSSVSNSGCPPTLFPSYDPYDDMIFMFMTHAWDYRHPTTITTLHPVFPTSTLPSGRYPLGGPTTLFGRSSLGGGRSSSIRSGSLSSPFVFGLEDVPRRTRLPLKILAYSRLLDLLRLEPSPIVYGRQLRLRPTSAPFDGFVVYSIFYYYFSYRAYLGYDDHR